MSNIPASPGNEAITACGDKMHNTNQYPTSLSHGERVYFCTRACLRAFEADPDRFMAGEIEHPMEEE